jgi:hypothetical protein
MGKTNPQHKARFNIGVECVCSCGWRSAMWLNKGAKGSASSEWRAHRAHCEAVDAIEAHDAVVAKSEPRS